MKSKLIVIILCLNSCLSNSSDMNNNMVVEKYALCNQINNIPENYDSVCKCIKDNELVFPINIAISGKIFQNNNKKHGTFKKDVIYKVDMDFISAFRTITADSANFEWGELATTYTDYMVEFYDKNDSLISTADVSYDGMLWTYPKLGITKWGYLTSKGEYKLKMLINEAVKEIKK